MTVYAPKILSSDVKLIERFVDLMWMERGLSQNTLVSYQSDLFKIAEKYILSINENINYKKYGFLLKLFDKAEIINIE